MGSSGSLLEAFVAPQGEGVLAGTPMLFLRLSGCRVGCRFCDTPHSWPRRPRGMLRRAGEGAPGEPFDNPVPAGRVLEWAGTFPRTDWVSITGGEPLEQPAFTAALARGLRASGRRVYLETAGLHPAALRRVRPHVDFVSMDWKLGMGKAARHRAFLKALGRTPGQVKAVVWSGAPEGEAARAMAAAARIRPDLPFVLQPVTPIGRLGPPEGGRLEALAASARPHLEVRILGQTHRPGGRGPHRAD